MLMFDVLPNAITTVCAWTVEIIPSDTTGFVMIVDHNMTRVYVCSKYDNYYTITFVLGRLPQIVTVENSSYDFFISGNTGYGKCILQNTKQYFLRMYFRGGTNDLQLNISRLKLLA